MTADPQGVRSAPQRYQFIVRTLLFITHGSDVLLLRGAPHKRLYANLYNGIGGHVERGESIHASAVREAAEEVGITALRNLRLRAVITIEVTPGILLFVFTAKSETRQVQPSAEGTPEWVSWRALAPETMPDDLPYLLRLLFETPGSDAITYLHYSYDESGQLIIQSD